MTDFDIGDPVRIDGEFRDQADTLIDPASLTLKVKPPSADALSYVYPTAPEIVRDNTGLFHATLDPEAIATSPEGVWGYRWIVPTGAVKGAEPGQFYVRPEFYDLLRPSVDAVASLLRARTKDDSNNEVGTFNENTRPTGEQVESLIDHATRAVLAAVPVDAPRAEYGNAVRSLAAIRAAMLVELSYFPEQINGDGSAYLQLKQLYDDSIGGLAGLLTGQDPAIAGIVSIPIRSSVVTLDEWVDPEPPVVA